MDIGAYCKLRYLVVTMGIIEAQAFEILEGKCGEIKLPYNFIGDFGTLFDELMNKLHQLVDYQDE